ncbi:MAG: cytochrome c [Bacteroidota bacterium]
MKSGKRIHKKSVAVKVTLLLGMVALLQACLDPESPGVEYMPDMYRTPALEPYAVYEAAWSPDSLMEARKPVAGTIPRGYMPYGLPNDTMGYRLSAAIAAPGNVPANPAMVAEGEVLYTKFCVHCHGKTGQGDGLVVTNGGHPPPAPYNSPNLKKLKEGTIFHVITYGKNAMGSHASQVKAEDRWKIVRYVQTLQNQ